MCVMIHKASTYSLIWLIHALVHQNVMQRSLCGEHGKMVSSMRLRMMQLYQAYRKGIDSNDA